MYIFRMIIIFSSYEFKENSFSLSYIAIILRLYILEILFYFLKVVYISYNQLTPWKSAL